MRMLGLYALIVLCLVGVYEAAIVPFSVTQSEILFDNKPSTQQTITFYCSETNAQGSLIVGNYDVHITCVPPVVQSTIQEIARIPERVELHSTDIACLVTDPERFLKAFRDAANEFISTGNSRRLLSFKTAIGELQPHARRLNFFADAIAIGLSTAALVIGVRAEAKADFAIQKVDALDAVVKNNTQVLKDLRTVVKEHGEHISDINRMITNITKSIVESNEATIRLIDTQNNTISTLETLTHGVQNTLKELQDNIKSTQEQTAAYVNGVNNQTHQQIISLAESMYSITESIKEEIKQIRVEHQITVQNINARDAAREDIASDRILMNSITAGVHLSLARLEDDMIAFLKNSGIAPTPLSGIDLVNLQEHMNIGFVTPVIGSVYEIHNVKMNYYLDTEYGIRMMVEQGTQVLSLSSMLTYFTTSNCKRAYIPADQSPDPDNGIVCQLYLEVEEYYCQTTLSPIFDWEKHANQTVDLQSNWCVGAGNIQPVVKTVIKTFEQYRNYIKTDLCPKRRSGTKFQLHLQRGQAIGYFNTSLECDIEWDTMLKKYGQGTGNPSLLFILLSTLNRVWSIANVDLAKRRIKRFGLLPGGIDVEVLPRFSVPTAINETTGVPIYDGAAEPSRCLQAHWTAISRNTVPVYSSILANNPAVDKSVIVTVTPRNGYVCENEAECYPVGSNIVKQNIVYQSDRFVKQEPGLFVGSLVKEVVETQGMYDISETQLACSSNPRANEGKACYINFPPKTTESWGLPEWITNNGDIYQPKKSAISLEDYRYKAVFDKDNSPMCGFPGGYHDWAINNITVDVHGCNNGFVWRNSTMPSVFDSTPSSIYPSVCFQPNTIVLFKELGDAAHVLKYSTSAASFVGVTNQIFSYWFQSLIHTDTASETIIVAIRGISSAVGTKYLKFIVDNLGQPAVVISSSLTSSSSLTLDTRTIGSTSKKIVTRNIRDGILHYIVFKQVITSYNTATGNVLYQLWIDGILQGEFKSADGAYLRSDSSPVYMNPGPQTGDNADTVSLGLIAPFSSVKLLNSYACQQGWMRKRCSQPTGTNIIIARMNVTHNNNIECMTNSKLVLSQHDFDLLYPQGVVGANELFNTPSWSIGFWIRLPASFTTGEYVLLRNALTSFRIVLNSVSGLLDLYVNGIVVASINVQDRDAHSIYITYNGVNTLVYLDGKLFGSSVAVNINTGGAGSVVSIVNDLNYVSMLKFYPSVVLNPTQINDEIRCVIDINIKTTSFVPQIGYCEVDKKDPMHGYCRSSLMCAGHCSGYATIDNSTNTFTIGSLNCDDGYKEPTCVKRCARIDDNTGRCIDLDNIYAAALTPLGYICNLARDYQLIMDLANSRLYQIPRQWLYLTTVQVPTGLVTSIIGNAACPKVEVIDLGAGELIVTLENTADVESNVQVKYAPNTYIADPNNVQCVGSCCNFNTLGTIYSIPPHLTYSLKVPTCGEMFIQISKLGIVNNVNEYEPCSTLTGTSLAAAVQTSEIKRTSNTLTGVKLLVDTASDHLFNIQQKMATASFDALLIQAIRANATDAELNTLLQVKNAITQSNVLTFNTTFNEINITGIIQSKLATLKNELVIAQTNIDQSNGLLKNIPALQAIIDAMLVNSTKTLADIQKTILANLVALTIIDAMKPNYGNVGEVIGKGIVDGVGGIAKVAVDGALGLAHAGVSLFDKVLDGVGLGGDGGGLIGNMFSGILKTLMQLLLPVAIIYGCYLLWKYRKSICSSNKKKKKKHKQEDEDDNEQQSDEEDESTKTKKHDKEKQKLLHRHQPKSDETEDVNQTPIESRLYNRSGFVTVSKNNGLGDVSSKNIN